MKNVSFQIEVVEEEDGCRTILRDYWVEIEGYIEIAYQEYNRTSHQWDDVIVTPAFSKDNCKKLHKWLEVAIENFLE